MLMQQNNLDVGVQAFTLRQIPCPVLLPCLKVRALLDKLEGFVSRHGPAFYRLPVNAETITLIKRDTPIEFPDKCETPDGPVTIFDCGQPLYWEVETVLKVAFPSAHDWAGLTVWQWLHAV